MSQPDQAPTEPDGRTTGPDSTVARPAFDADDVAGAVSAVAGVAGLHGGTFGEAGTYLPGRRVTGVREVPDGVEIHIGLDYGVPVRETAADVRTAAAPLVGGRAVHVIVEDIVAPAGPRSADSGS